MKNPLRKRFLRDLRSDCGRYIAVFLFLVLFIGIVSGFLVADNSVFASYTESFTKYNVEDGHLTFGTEAPQTLLREIEQSNDLRLYPLYYKNETLDNTDADVKKTVRIYAMRETVNTVCRMQGELPNTADEIAVDRMFAENNNITVGDTLTFAGNAYTVSGFVALPDYSCLYEDNGDLMFSAVNFGVAVTTDAGFARLGEAHCAYNYAWKYNTACRDEAEENDRSQTLMDSLESILKAHAQTVLQEKVNAVWDDAQTLSAKLEPQIEAAADAVETKITAAAQTATEKAVASMTTDQTLAVVLELSGMTQEQIEEKLLDEANLTVAQKLRLAWDARTKGDEEVFREALEMAGITEDELPGIVLRITGLTQEQAAEALLQAYCAQHHTTVEALVATQLGTTVEALKALQDAFENAQTQMDGMDIAGKEPPQIDLDNLDEDADLGMDVSFDEIYAVLDKVDAANVYDTTAIRATISAFEALADVRFDDSGIVEVRDYLPRYLNLAITFTGDDMGSDKASILLISYIVIGILAFVFAVTTSNTITREAGAIGTLRASGYSRVELVRHYLLLPMLVTFLAAVVGNVLGYTVFETLFVRVYYLNYSLVTYETLPNAEAFLQTTVTPIVLMFVVNLTMLIRKLRVRPLDFLRGQTSGRRRRRALRLPKKLPFLLRFHLRVLFQNLGAFAVLFVGILFGGVLAVFSMMFGPLLADYSALVRDNMIAAYQTVVADTQDETAEPTAEKFCLTTLNTTVQGFVTDSVMVYGIEPDSRYIHAGIPDGKVLVCDGVLEKFGLQAGDTITLKEKYSSKTYTFTIAGGYNYPASLAVFLPRADYLETFDKGKEYFTGYFSDQPLTDLTSEQIAATITQQDLTKVSDQMEVSMLGFMDYFMYFGIVIFLLLMFLLTKQVIEKNGASIAMTKILGFKNTEIGRLYLVSTFIAVLGSLFLSIPLISVMLRWAFRVYLYKKLAGYIPYIISDLCYVKLVVMGVASYLVVAAGMLLKIRKVPMGEALKKQNL